ncbi:type VI secretion system baseplate subunit TssG [Sphingobacterium sp. Mn56C]|uniref:type VI secretion system baseplate subunit TssG n=1 Tax=Sphingobacterium sp. Mn56C TaxID=3395261 RepID=UPI003BD51A10
MKQVYNISGNWAIQNNLFTDYKAEVIALNLMKYFTNIEQVFLNRMGGSHRTIQKDIVGVHSHWYALDALIVELSSCRDGIYDYLPEGVFHAPYRGNSARHVDAIRSHIHEQNKVEAAARTFFKPFEQESFFVTRNALQQEHAFETMDQSPMFLQVMKELWSLLGAVDPNTAKIFIHLLPFFHRVKGNSSWLAKCLTAFLNIPVTITFVPNKVKDFQSGTSSVSLSNFHLGISMVLSGEHFDGNRNWCIQYGPIPYAEMANYVPKSALRTLLSVLYSHFVPANIAVEEAFLTNRNTDSFVVSKSQDTNRLGYTTYL